MYVFVLGQKSLVDCNSYISVQRPFGLKQEVSIRYIHH